MLLRRTNARKNKMVGQNELKIERVIKMTTTHNYTKEIIRASSFLVRQLKRGYSVQEAIIQVEQSYTYAIGYAVLKSFRRWSKVSKKGD